MRWSTPALVLVCAILAATGFFLRRSSPSGHRRAEPATDAQAPAASSASSTSAAKSAATGVQPAAAVPPWAQRWQESFGEPNTPARNRKLAELIAELAKTDPQRALALAQSVDDWRLRDLLRDAALRGWASVDSTAAGDWALTVRVDDRRRAVEAVMQGAATHPAEAVRVALRLCAADPERGGDYGHYTIAALVDSGAFADAVRFGEQIGTEKYPFLLKSAFFQWSRNQPGEAMAALDDISDPIVRAQARGEAISGWAWADPKGLAAYALTLPAGGSRREALSEALPLWVEKDPAAAMEWMRHNESGSDTDAGVAAVANQQSLITQQPATAMGMASTLISDPDLRSHTMRAVFRQWAENDPPSARQYLERTPEGPDRTLLLKELHDLLPGG